MIAKESSDLTHIRGSFRFWILVVVCAYFGLALYWAIIGVNWSIELISDHYVYQELSKGPWWWMILYYGSEGLSGTLGSVLRAVAGFFAFYSAVLFWRKKESALSLIRGKVGTALLLEGAYFLSFIPSTVAAFVYYLANENLYYFDHIPGLVFLCVVGVPCLMIITIIPPLLFKLRSKIIQGSSSQGIIKWSCLAGVAYLFLVFWFNYSMAWVANMIPFGRAQGQYGLSFLLEPINLAGFIATVFGLFLIAIFGLMSTLPAMKKLPIELSLRRIGTIMMAFGGYFIFNLLIYVLTGGYVAHPNVWYEVIGPPHNPNLWCVTFLFLGLALLTSCKLARMRVPKLV
jgi:hypothetical protein